MKNFQMMKHSGWSSYTIGMGFLAIFAVLLIIVGGDLQGICSGSVTAGFDPTATTTSAIGTVATFLGVLVPISLGVAVIFWMVRKGIAMFKGGSKAIVAGGLTLGGYGLMGGHASASPLFATFAAGYDPTANFTDAIGLVASYLGVIVPLALGVAVIFWMVRKGIAMFKGGSK